MTGRRATPTGTDRKARAQARYAAFTYYTNKYRKIPKNVINSHAFNIDNPGNICLDISMVFVAKSRMEKRRRPGLIDDLRNLSFRNRDENKVLEARHVSAYKGRLVIKKAGAGRRSFSLWALFISPELAAGDQNAIDTVKHEYGHTEQLKRLGLPAYLKAIGYPSMKSDMPGSAYYSLPWEVTADMLGGVEREHAEGSEEIGEAYLAGRSARRKPGK